MQTEQKSLNKSRLITSSLIGSIEWYRTAPNSKCKNDPTITWKEKAYNDLSNSLNRIWTGANDACKHGIAFEDKVYSIVNSIKAGKLELDDLASSELFKQVVKACIGGTFQDKLKSIEVIDGNEYCLYGKSDVMFPDYILDLKTTASFKASKYSNSFQHKLYLYLEKKNKFEYLVAEWKEYPKIKDLHSVTIEVENGYEAFKPVVHSTVIEAMKFLEARPILWKAYLTKFCK